jgi:hypothetical protein
MAYELVIRNKGKQYMPLVEGDITWETVRIGQPGKLTFNILKDDTIDFQEGNSVTFKVDGKNLFYGFIFSKDRDKDQIISVTAYDKLRYLKNKDIYQYTEKKASEVLKEIAQIYDLSIGTVEDTGYVIPQRVKENVTLLDIIYDALEITLRNKGKMYVLYDDYGNLMLKDIETMKIPDLVIGEYNSQNFSYKTDIDTDTYNVVKLYRSGENVGKEKPYVDKDDNNIDNWGVLQYLDKIDENVNPKVKAEILLKMKNRKSRTLQLKDCLGDTRVRAGTSVMVLMRDIGDVSIQQYMLVEKVKHTFRNDEHFMSLDLRGDI